MLTFSIFHAQNACTSVAALLHYFYLAAFFIMLVEGIQLSIYVFAVFHYHRKRQTFAMIFAAWCEYIFCASLWSVLVVSPTIYLIEVLCFFFVVFFF